MRKKLILRKFHRYVALIVGIQLFLWSIGGFYFSLFPISEIHGNHLKSVKPSFNWYEIQNNPLFNPLVEMLKEKQVSLTDIQNIQFETIHGKLYYKIERTGKKLIWVNGASGEIAQLLDKENVKAIAMAASRDTGTVQSIDWITSVTEDHEYREKPLPAYRVVFDGKDSLHMYLDGYTGKVLSMRTTKWRIFDFMWMLHVMDYETRDDFNHFLLQFFAFLAVVTSLTGIVLWVVTWRPGGFSWN